MLIYLLLLRLLTLESPQPISIISAIIFVGTGVGMFFYFQYEKARMERKRIADASKGMGKPKVGGPFELLDQDGRPWNSRKEMGGKFSLVSRRHIQSERDRESL